LQQDQIPAQITKELNIAADFADKREIRQEQDASASKFELSFG